jgi:hypothetical protein
MNTCLILALYQSGWLHENLFYLYSLRRARGSAVVEALRYKPEGCGIDSRWCHWNFSLT